MHKPDHEREASALRYSDENHQLQSRLAAAGCGIPIIFITAYENNDSRRRVMLAIAGGFLGKPFRDKRLFQTIYSALRLFHRTTAGDQEE